MKLLNHKKMVKKAGFISFPDAVDRLALATAEPEWRNSEYADYLPCSVAVDPKTKKLRVKRLVLYRVGRGYRLSSKDRPALRKGEIKAFRAHRSHYAKCAKDIIRQIARNKIEAIAAVPYMPYIKLDESNDNLLTSQFDTLCCTGYVGYMLSDGNLYYGLVSVHEAQLSKFIKGELTSVTSGTYCKVTPAVKEAHREFIKRLIAFTNSVEGKELSKGELPQFIVDDFKLDVVRMAIGAIASNPQLASVGVAPSSLRRIVMAAVEGVPCFPSKSGGKRNPEKRECGRVLIQKIARTIVDEGNEQEDESEEDAQEAKIP